MFPLLSLKMEALGISSSTIGYNSAMQPLGIVLSVFAIPPLVRNFGAKKVVIAAAVLTAAVILCYPFFPVFWWWFGLRVMRGSVSTLFAIGEAWVVRFAEGAWRSRILWFCIGPGPELRRRTAPHQLHRHQHAWHPS